MIEAAALEEALEGTIEVAQEATEAGGESLKFGDSPIPDIDSPDSLNRGDFIDTDSDSSKLSLDRDFVCPEGQPLNGIDSIETALSPEQNLTNIPDIPKQQIEIPDVDSPDAKGVAESAGETIQDNASDTIEGPKRFPCKNEKYAGMNHPETGVPYKEKVVIDSEGNEVIGVFPQFESVIDVQLPDDLLLASDNKQFAECGRKLKEKCLSDPDFASQFSERQLDDIMNERTPPYGFVWHHNEEVGKMQLVDYDTHADTRHTGGKAIWGGGRDYR